LRWSLANFFAWSGLEPWPSRSPPPKYLDYRCESPGPAIKKLLRVEKKFTIISIVWGFDGYQWKIRKRQKKSFINHRYISESQNYWTAIEIHCTIHHFKTLSWKPFCKVKSKEPFPDLPILFSLVFIYSGFLQQKNTCNGVCRDSSRSLAGRGSMWPGFKPGIPFLLIGARDTWIIAESWFSELVQNWSGRSWQMPALQIKLSYLLLF
jgi:hypothetical protein